MKSLLYTVAAAILLAPMSATAQAPSAAPAPQQQSAAQAAAQEMWNQTVAIFREIEETLASVKDAGSGDAAADKLEELLDKMLHLAMTPPGDLTEDELNDLRNHYQQLRTADDTEARCAAACRGHVRRLLNLDPPCYGSDTLQYILYSMGVAADVEQEEE